ncbi:MAG TPA: arsinothricin resistance N-acetyltransferase ArsN1 family A [Gemmataceae bacterium]|nr:arsinothricin resistance N-acetyltransferase ArsN1 family A [Gemmataceae bacterium]
MAATLRAFARLHALDDSRSCQARHLLRRAEVATLHARDATPEDATAMAVIYNQGIEDRIATFETCLRSGEDVAKWFDGVHPIVVVERGGAVVAFAATSTYRPRQCYAGVAEFSVYVRRTERGRGLGKLALRLLMEAARKAGYWKLVSRVFVENAASRGLLKSLGFREVGVYEKHGQLDGVWRDVVIVERLLTDVGREDS